MAFLILMCNITELQSTYSVESVNLAVTFNNQIKPNFTNIVTEAINLLLQPEKSDFVL